MGDYNPFTSYFDGLEKWDNKDYIKELSGYIKTDVSCETYKEEYLKYWLVGCVAQCFPDDEYNLRKKYGQHGKNQYCLIFQGEQQKGKTEFFEFLASSIGHEYFYSGDVDSKNKDSIISVAENFIVHLDELSDKIRYYKTLEQYKSLVAGAQTINVRKPYDREHLLLKRHASFCASINDAHGLLKDLTGARRWMILTGVDINRKLYDNIDLDKLWAQAFSLYLSGFKHWYDDPEILNSRNEEYRGHGIEEELILDGIADNVFSVGKRYTASQVLKELNKKYEHSKNLSHVSIGKVCNKLFKRTRTNGRSEYTIIEQTQAKIENFNEDEIF
jgi:predicted P-loop ATPase